MSSRWTRCYILSVLLACYIRGSALVPIIEPCSVRNRRRFPLRRALCVLTAKSITNKYDEAVDPDSVTDAEALLACRAYLQRKNRLGAWKDYQRRKESLRQASSSFEEGVGYFWEDPEQLVYLDHEDDDEDEDDVDEKEEGVEGRVVFENLDLDGTVTMWMGADKAQISALAIGAAEFTSFPTNPSTERQRRSHAAKTMWSDPEWRERWYAKRWGRLRHTSPLLAKQKRLDDRMRSMPTKLFESEQLASLSEEEITEAIRSYVMSNRKRSRAHTKDAILEKKKRAEMDSSERLEKGAKSKLDLYVSSSQDVMKEAQRKRSERAAKAYETRLANQDRRRNKSSAKVTTSNRVANVVPTDPLPTSKAPQDAVIRIQAQLESNQLPSLSDVEIILKPLKLGRRKDMLRRILNEHFDLRGKCVPSNFEGGDSGLLFVTQSSIDELGSFVLLKMKERCKESG